MCIYIFGPWILVNLFCIKSGHFGRADFSFFCQMHSVVHLLLFWLCESTVNCIFWFVNGFQRSRRIRFAFIFSLLGVSVRVLFFCCKMSRCGFRNVARCGKNRCFIQIWWIILHRIPNWMCAYFNELGDSLWFSFRILVCCPQKLDQHECHHVLRIRTDVTEDQRRIN